MNKTTIAALILALPLATTSAKADVVTNYNLGVVMNIGLESADDDLYGVTGGFAYDYTNNIFSDWTFHFDASRNPITGAPQGGPVFTLSSIPGVNVACGPIPPLQPFAQTNATFTEFEFWVGSSTFPDCSFTFDIAAPLFTGSEPVEDAAYFGIFESTGNTFDFGTLSAVTTVDEPSPLILFAFGALAIGWLGWRSQFSSGGQS
jgi:hypothetical protein